MNILRVHLSTQQFVPKDQLIWKYVRGVNVKCYANVEEAKARLGELSIAEQDFFMSHTYFANGKVNEILDDGCMWNHSEDPNTYSGFQGDWDSSYARRDIQIGEELLDDYGKNVFIR